MVRHWTAPGRDVLVAGSITEEPERAVAGWREAGVGALLIQYVPFLYGRRGLSRFPERVARAARAAGMRTSVFVHEPWVPLTRLPWLVLSPLQRRQLRRLLALADAAATPVPAWREMLGRNVTLVYVGSTLGDPPPLPPAEPPLGAPVVFSPFASGLNWEWIVAACHAVGTKPGLTILGGDWNTARRHPILHHWADPTWDWRGRLPAPETLTLLARARVVLAPFHDGLTARRTSAFAAASVGARLISSRGHLFDPAFEAAPFALANNKNEFAELARALFQQPEPPSTREARVHWYAQRLEPADVDRSLLTLVTGMTAQAA